MADDARPPFLSRAEWLRLTEEGKDVGAPLSSPEDPINERARIRLESVRDFVLIEGGRLIALPDVLGRPKGDHFSQRRVAGRTHR